MLLYRYTIMHMTVLKAHKRYKTRFLRYSLYKRFDSAHISAKLHYTDTGSDMLYNAPTVLWTSSQHYSTTCCTTNSPPNGQKFATSQHLEYSGHVEMLGCGIAMYNMFVAGVRIVEFGT